MSHYGGPPQNQYGGGNAGYYDQQGQGHYPQGYPPQPQQGYYPPEVGVSISCIHRDDRYKTPTLTSRIRTEAIDN